MIPLMSNNKVFFVKKLNERKIDHMFKSIYNSHFFSPHVSRAQRLAPARTRTRVVRLGAQCTDHWTTSQSRGVDGPAAHLTKHVKSSTLCGRTVVRSYGRTTKFFLLDGWLLFCIIIGLCSASSAIIRVHLPLSGFHFARLRQSVCLLLKNNNFLETITHGVTSLRTQKMKCFSV